MEIEMPHSISSSSANNVLDANSEHVTIQDYSTKCIALKPDGTRCSNKKTSATKKHHPHPDDPEAFKHLCRGHWKIHDSEPSRLQFAVKVHHISAASPVEDYNPRTNRYQDSNHRLSDAAAILHPSSGSRFSVLPDGTEHDRISDAQVNSPGEDQVIDPDRLSTMSSDSQESFSQNDFPDFDARQLSILITKQSIWLTRFGSDIRQEIEELKRAQQSHLAQMMECLQAMTDKIEEVDLRRTDEARKTDLAIQASITEMTKLGREEAKNSRSAVSTMADDVRDIRSTVERVLDKEAKLTDTRVHGRKQLLKRLNAQVSSGRRSPPALMR